MHIGFIGIGNMGAAMVRRLLKAGHQVMAFNRTRDKAAALEGEGARTAGSPKEAAQFAEVLFTMLADDKALLDSLLAADGALAGLAPGRIHVSSSTIGTETSRQVAERHQQAGHAYVAAPVLGRPEAAEAGKLVVLAAGPKEAIQTCRPLFDVFAATTHVLGEIPEQANAAKLAANAVLATMIQALGEAYALVEHHGVQAGAFLEALNGSLLKSPVIGNYGRIIADRKFDPPGFQLALGLKDVRLTVEAAQSKGMRLPVIATVRNRLEQAVSAGLAHQDWSAVARMV